MGGDRYVWLKRSNATWNGITIGEGCGFAMMWELAVVPVGNDCLSHVWKLSYLLLWLKGTPERESEE